MTVHNLGVAAIVFDFDGTIIDTESPTYATWRQIYRQYGYDLPFDDWKRSIGSHGSFDPAESLAVLAGWECFPPSLLNRVTASIQRACGLEPLRPGIMKLLSEVEALGLPKGIASSSSSTWVETWLEYHGLTQRFQVVVGRDQVAKPKPAPDVYLLAADRLGVEPAACLAIEDSPHGVQAAHAARMQCLAVPNALTARLEFPEEVQVRANYPTGLQIKRMTLNRPSPPQGPSTDEVPPQARADESSGCV